MGDTALANTDDPRAADLALRARAGDTRAFDSLREHYRRRLRGFLRTRTLSPIGDEDLEDLEQQVWLAAYEALPGFDPEKGNFFTFLKNCIAQWKAKQWKADPRLTWLEDKEEHVQESLLCDEAANPETLMAVESLERARIEAFHLLCRLLFLCGGYPHQQLAFAFLKIIYAGGTKAQGSSATVVEQHGRTCLEPLSLEFLSRYQRISGLSPREMSRTADTLEPLHQRLALTLEEMMRRDQASLQQHARLSESSVGATTIEDYYSGHRQTPTAAISDWAYGVQKRIVSVLSGSKMDEDGEIPRHRAQTTACVRCKLRRLPPCADLEDPLAGAIPERGNSCVAATWLENL